MADKRVCMTIPQQECRETRVPSCQNVTREQVIPASDWSTIAIQSSDWSILTFLIGPLSQCRVVPKERCALVTSEGLQPRARCRVNTRLVCEDRPRQKCGNKVRI